MAVINAITDIDNISDLITIALTVIFGVVGKIFNGIMNWVNSDHPVLECVANVMEKNREIFGPYICLTSGIDALPVNIGDVIAPRAQKVELKLYSGRMLNTLIKSDSDGSGDNGDSGNSDDGYYEESTTTSTSQSSSNSNSNSGGGLLH